MTSTVPSVDQSDAALCILHREGNEAARDILVERYFPLVRRRANRLRAAGVEADDLTQEGLIGLLFAMRAYNPEYGAAFSTFAYRCITNRMLSSIAMAGHVPVPVSPEQLHPLGGEQDDPQAVLASHEQSAQWLYRMSERLSCTEQKTLRLYLSGYSYQEMADTLQSTTKAVDNALQRARRKLREN